MNRRRLSLHCIPCPAHCTHRRFCKNNPQTDLASSMAECKMAVCGAVQGLLQKLNLRADQIDILVTT